MINEQDKDLRKLKRAKTQKKYRDNNKEKYSELKKIWCSENVEKCREARRRHYLKYKDKKHEYYVMHLSNPINRIKYLIGVAKRRSIKSGIEFDNNLIQHLSNNIPTHCRCCGLELDFSLGNGKNRKSLKPSLDRIDNIKGYTVNNTFIICLKCNIMKNSMSLVQIEQILKYMKENT